VFGFEDLAKIIFRENDGELLLDGMERSIANVEKIGAKRKMRAVFFENAERKNADALGLSDGVAKI
jgi:hypothetical protein